MPRPHPLARTAAALGLLAGAVLAGRLLFPAAPPAAAADQLPEQRGALLEVITSQKTNEPLVFLYDGESHRLLMYTTVGGAELKLAAVREVAYDKRIHEYNNQNEKGMTVRELKKAFEEEDKSK